MKNITKKIYEARKIVGAIKTKKDGRNEFSKYDYFTPEFVSSVVSSVCTDIGLLTKFDLKKDEFGYFGELTIIDIDSEEMLTYIMRTEKPAIKATNETQQMGGCYTYTHRYLLMGAFDIVDNRLDFDCSENKHQEKIKEKLDIIEEKKANEAEWDSVISFCTSVEELTKVYQSMSKEQRMIYAMQLTDKKNKINKTNKCN